MPGPNWAEQVTAIATVVGALGAAVLRVNRSWKRGRVGNPRLRPTSSADGMRTRYSRRAASSLPSKPSIDAMKGTGGYPIFEALVAKMKIAIASAERGTNR